jgi:hypothetical protein
MMKLSIILFSLGACSPAYARGGATGVGGGGDVVVLPNDQVVLADPFLNSGAEQPNGMPPLRSINPRILQAIGAYTQAAVPEFVFFSSPRASDITRELERLKTRNSGLRFYGVQSQEELNNFCAPGGRKSYNLPEGYSVEQVACTAGVETYFVEPIFAKLSLRDQALLLIHERLTTLRDKQGGKNYQAIAQITTGLSLYLDLYREQTVQETYRTLTADQASTLTNFYVAIEELEKRNSDTDQDSFQWAANTIGGGKVHAAAAVDPTATVGLLSVVPRGSRIGARSQLLGSNGTELTTLHIGSDVVLKDTFFTDLEDLTVGEHTSIVSSELDLGPSLVIAANQTMNNGMVNSESYQVYPKSVRVSPIRLSYSRNFPEMAGGFTNMPARCDQNYVDYKSDDGQGVVTLSGRVQRTGSCTQEFGAPGELFAQHADVQFDASPKPAADGLYALNQKGEVRPAGYYRSMSFKWPWSFEDVIYPVLKANPRGVRVELTQLHHDGGEGSEDVILLYYPVQGSSWE